MMTAKNQKSRRSATIARFVAGLPMFLVAAAAGIFALVHVAAQPARDRMLEDVRILLSERQGAIVEIRFPFRLQYLSHFPADTGDELRIRFRPIQIPDVDRDAVYKREALVPRYGDVVDLDEVAYEGDLDQGVYVTLRFRRTVAYQVTATPDFTGVQIKVTPLEPGGRQR
jgi:hypothetical protein